jgi:hypothetical protein
VRGSGFIVPSLLTSALVGGEWSVLPSSRFNLVEGAPISHWIGGWVGKISCPCRESNICRPKILLVIQVKSNWSTALQFACGNKVVKTFVNVGNFKELKMKLLNLN